MTYDKKEILDLIRRAFATNRILPFHISEAAYNLYILVEVLGLEEDQEVSSQLKTFKAIFSNSDLAGALEDQVSYAVSLAASKRELEYEEIHKLFSLCDHIYTLRYFLPNQLNIDKEKVFESAIQERLQRDAQKAAMVREDRFEPWMEKFWWYRGGEQLVN